MLVVDSSILVSAFLQFAYFQLVAAAYRAGDIGLVYPLMRGAAPLLVATTSGVVLGEHLTSAAMAGVLVISAGVLTLAFCGAALEGARAVHEAGIDAYFPILREIVTLDEAMQKDTAATNLSTTVEEVLRVYHAVLYK